MDADKTDKDAQHSAVPANSTEKLTLSQRFADAVTGGMGSWTFILGQTAVLAAWIGLNVTAVVTPWDPNLTLLNLALSCEAAFAGAFILMSQNRRDEKNRLLAQNDYLVDLKSEQGIKELNRKLDILTAMVAAARAAEVPQVPAANNNGDAAVKEAVKAPVARPA